MSVETELALPPAFRFQLEAAKIREFVFALGNSNSIHRDREAAQAAGYRDLVAPIGLIVWTIGQDRDVVFERLGLSAHRGLTTGEGWTFLEPICAGDILTGATRRIMITERSSPTRAFNLHHLETKYVNQFEQTVLIERTVIAQWASSTNDISSDETADVGR